MIECICIENYQNAIKFNKIATTHPIQAGMTYAAAAECVIKIHQNKISRQTSLSLRLSLLFNRISSCLNPHMKKDIHPKYGKCIVKCVCGNVFETRSTVSEINVEICGICHPVYTGKQKIVDSTGRVDRFKKMLDQKKENVMSKKEKRALKSQKRANEKSKVKSDKKMEDNKKTSEK